MSHFIAQEFTDEVFRAQVAEMARVCNVTFNEHLSAHCLLALVNDLTSYVHYDEEAACFSFTHESILESLMSSFVTRHPQHVFESRHLFNSLLFTLMLCQL